MEKKRNSGMFAPGKSGNPSGKSKLKPLSDRIRMILAQEPERAHKIADALIKEAEGGNLQATAMIMDRLEGRPTQSLEITDARQVTEIAEIDRRIDELSNRLRVAPLIDASAEDVEVDDETTRH